MRSEKHILYSFSVCPIVRFLKIPPSFLGCSKSGVTLYLNGKQNFNLKTKQIFTKGKLFLCSKYFFSLSAIVFLD